MIYQVTKASFFLPFFAFRTFFWYEKKILKKYRNIFEFFPEAERVKFQLQNQPFQIGQFYSFGAKYAQFQS